jgi:hypothetical protein
MWYFINYRTSQGAGALKNRGREIVDTKKLAMSMTNILNIKR